eukprot:CAMPEP_0119004144 /NCGR_PEP_ID=MMETSP1176-20130426/980_1 /TAXON_ID=265551 /ORGANISM="Synedropsis recta cf, Strain CCMP1620" /LENGTH=267 /DNA_ID=CAMNT_0006955821 /DNA_START=55 /DNA_END=858 /DNA_ORIENTATION=+
MVSSVSFLALSLLLVGADGFSMKMSAQTDGRRSFLAKIATTTAAVTASIVGAPSPALAVGGKNKVNAKLQSFGLPPAAIPDGLTPLLHIYGKGANRFPILVEFSHPVDWVVTYPNNDANGEDGTIQAGEYAKGDTATFFLYEAPGNVKSITSKPKEFFEQAIVKAISQKGDNVYQDFKVTNLEPVKGDYRDQEYMIVDFRYVLLTGAGFEVDRRGVASVTSEGKAVEVLWCASTRQRFKKTEQSLRGIAGSFRCYTDGLNFSDELVA